MDFRQEARIIKTVKSSFNRISVPHQTKNRYILKQSQLALKHNFVPHQFEKRYKIIVYCDLIWNAIIEVSNPIIPLTSNL